MTLTPFMTKSDTDSKGSSGGSRFGVIHILIPGKDIRRNGVGGFFPIQVPQKRVYNEEDIKMPVITISRQFGAGGITLGDLLSQKTGLPFFNNEVIQKVATKAKVSEDWVKSIEKEAGGPLLKFMSNIVPKNLVERILGQERGYIDEEIYTDILKDVINKLADEGDCIILGRGSQYILKDRPDAFHILLVGDKEDRIAFMEKKYKLTRKQAEYSVNINDKRRVGLYRKFGKEDYDSPNHYHLVFNMSKMDFERTTDILCCVLQSKQCKIS